MKFSNAEIVEANRNLGRLRSRIDVMFAELEPFGSDNPELTEATGLLSMAETARVHHGVAIGVASMGRRERAFRALGHDAASKQRLAVLFADHGTWCARLYYHRHLGPGRPKDPGAFDFDRYEDAQEVALSWVASGDLPAHASEDALEAEHVLPHVSPDPQPNVASASEVNAHWRALDAVLSSLNALDTDGKTGNQVKLEVYHLVMAMRPPAASRHEALESVSTS